MRYKKLNTTVKEAREADVMRAKVEEQAAMIEYIAIMADVELPEEESEDINEQ